MLNPTVKKSLHFLSFLLILGIICGGLLATVNSFTSPVIEKRKQEEVQRQLEGLFGSDYIFNVQETPKKSDSVITEMYSLYDLENNKIGVIYKTTTDGFGGDIVSLIAITFSDDVIFKHKVIDSSKETVGNAVAHDFGVTGSSIDGYSFSAESGATISGNGVKAGIEAAIANYKANKGTLMGE